MTHLTLLQALLAIVFSVFAYLQMQLISGLGEGRVDTSFAIQTALLFVLYVGLDLREDYLRGSVYAKLSAEMKTDAARAFLTDSFQNHSRKTAEEHISYFTGEVDAVLNQHFYFSLYQPKLLFQFATGFAVLLVISWQCGLAVTVAVVGFALIIRLFSKKIAAKQRRVQENKAVFVDTLSELHNGYEEIHLNQMQHLAEEDFASSNVALEQAQYDYRLAQSAVETLGVGQNMLIYMLILIVGGMLAYHGYTGLGVFVSAATLSVQLLNHWSLLSRIKASQKAVEPLKQELDAYRGVQSPSELKTLYTQAQLQGGTLPSHLKSNQSSVSLAPANGQLPQKRQDQEQEQGGEHVLLQASGVSFGYKTGEDSMGDHEGEQASDKAAPNAGGEAETTLIQNVNLEIARGQKCLITGDSGSGKSTLLELLNGHMDCDGGRIERYTEKIAYIPQSSFLFHGTLRENLVFDGVAKDEEMLALLRKLELDFPLEMVVEGGLNLSGGEKARVVLARALLSQPDLLITDELTANLDGALGRKIEEMLLTDYPDMALCSVAHRTYCAEQYDKRWHLAAKTWEVK